MREKLGILLAVSAFLLVALVPSGSALADSVTTLGSYSDPRGAMPTRPGHTIKRVRMGSSTTQTYTVNANSQVHNAIRFDAPAPCTNCWITDMVPSLVYTGDANQADGTVANLNNDMMMHHFVLLQSGRTDLGCPGGLQSSLGERFFAAGNERSQMHLPAPYGYYNTASSFVLIAHLVNKSAVQKKVNIEVTYQYRTTGGENAQPVWLDIDGCSDSEYTAPTGYSDTHSSWTSTLSGRVIGMTGHLHDVDITSAAPCLNHCPAQGQGIALSAELVGGSASTYYGPVPPNNSPPADLTGSTLCRSEGYYGTTWAGSQWRGHLDTMSTCGIFTDLLPGKQAEAFPAGGAFPTNGVAVNAGQVIKLHSEYQNDTGAPQTDVMGIMITYFATPSPYPRPKGATPTRVSLVPAFNACTSPNRVHGPPDFPGNGSNPDGSCNPPTQTSSQLTVGAPDANGAPAKSEGSVVASAIVGNPGTPADEADARFKVDMTDVRNKTGLGDYTGQIQLETTIRVIDRDNGPGETGVVQDTPFRVTVPCTATGDTTVGSTCSVNTTADAVLGAGAIKEGKRSIWQLGQVRINDGGSDGVASTTPNALFATQGVLVP